MPEGFVQKAIRRSNIASLLVAAFGIIIVLVLGVAFGRYFYNWFKGPFAIAPASLIGLQNPEEQLAYYVTVQGDQAAYDTGVQYVETDKHGNESVTSYYAALPLQGNLLLVRTSKPELLAAYTGKLISLPQDEQNEVIAKIEAEVPALKGVFLPVMLDAADFKTAGYLGIATALGVVLLCLFLFISVVRHSSDPSTHPIMRMLSAYGDPEATAMQLESDMASAGQKIAHLSVGQNWLASDTLFGLKAMRISDLAWLYKQEITRRSYGIVVQRSYFAVLYDRNGKSIRVSDKQARIDELLVTLHNRAPFAINGYNSGILSAWRKNRQEVINEVDRRKRVA